MFQANSTVCFIGDSITADGRWIYELYEFFNEKKINIQLYNCGIPGGKVSETLERIDTDCLEKKPDTIVSMFGLNDINYHLYGEKYYFSESERKKAIEEFEEGFEKLAVMAKEAGISLVLMTPPPYGDFVKSGTENLVHANQGVAEIIKILEQKSEKHNLPLVDINSLFAKHKDTMRLINADRLHPTAQGHYLIAQGLLLHFSLIDNIDCSYPLKRSLLNTKRYEEEKIIRAVIFTEWYIFKEYRNMPSAFVKNKAKEEIKKYSPGEFFYDQLEMYIKYIDEIEIHKKLLEEYTKG